MSSNLIGGFFQRLDRARKYAFGSMLVTGEANDNKITGYFVFRGQDVPFEVTDAADYESYKFTKADASSPTVRAEFNDYISWAGPNLPGKFQVCCGGCMRDISVAFAHTRFTRLFS